MSLDKQIEKILGYKSYSLKRKEDSLLELDCILYTNLGTESTDKERKSARQNSIKILKAIKDINWELGSSLLYAMDR